MTLMEKFASLTPEQREKFAAVKDAAALDTFVSEHGMEMTDEEKAQILEYIKTGVLPLSDDALDAAAGGAKGDMSSKVCTEAWFRGHYDYSWTNCACCSYYQCYASKKWVQGLGNYPITVYKCNFIGCTIEK